MSRSRFIVRGGVFNGRLRWYVWDNEEKRQCTEATSHDNAMGKAIRFAQDVSGESLKRVGA